MINIYFNQDYVKDYYLNNIKSKSGATGIDKVNIRTFEKQIFSNIETICNKVQNNSYKFTRYKGILIPKKPDKHPRAIAISTIRDKLVLSIIKDMLLHCYNYTRPELVHSKIHKIKTDLQKYTFNSFLKLDIKDFFPSICHSKLLSKLESDGVDKRIINLIKRAITQDIDFDGYIYDNNRKESKGVPQGLPISNVLAEVYISEFDKKHLYSTSYKYYRYVDDILILYDSKQTQDIFSSISSELKESYNLNVHDLDSIKTCQGKLAEGFDFLGYRYDNNKFTVRESTINRLEKSIEGIFSKHRKRSFKNMDLFLWELNNRITGVVVESKKIDENSMHTKKKYGWLFFFSQIDDQRILYRLDLFIQKMLDRYKVRNKLQSEKDIKKFVRSYNEIIYKRSSTKYIPNYARYTAEEKRKLLNDVFKKKDVLDMRDDDIERQFYNIIYRAIKDVEADVQDFS